MKKTQNIDHLSILNSRRPCSLVSIIVTAMAIVGTAQWANADSIWNATPGSSANINWSSAANWTPNGVPGSAANVCFGNSGYMFDTTINSVADAGFAGPIASLSYTNMDHGSYQNTRIASGVTVNVNGPLNVGSITVPNPTMYALTKTTISGAGGTLNINTSTNCTVGWTCSSGYSGGAYLDMSGLDNFNATFQRFIIGQGNSGTLAYGSGMVYLAKTNVLTGTGTGTGNSSTLDIGDNNGNAGYPSYLYLGLTNVMNIRNIGCGLRKQIYVGDPATGSGIMFNPAFTNNNPVAYFRGNDGVSPVSNWYIGDGVSASSTVNNWGACDFSGGTVNAVVTALVLGRTAQGAKINCTATGSLTFSAGTFSVNAITNGLVANSNTNNAVGTITVNGTGVLSVNSFVLAALLPNTNGNGTFSGSSLGTLNITNGTVAAQTITSGGGISTINLDSGTLIITNTAGTAAAPLSALNLTRGTLRLRVNGGVTNIVAGAVTTSGTTAINIDSISNVGSGTVTVPLMRYTNGVDPFAGLSLGTVPSGYTSASLVDDTANQTIDLAFTVASAPTIASLSPAYGVTNGGTLVTINGANFVSGLTVKFGSASASSVNYSSATLVAAVTPARVPGAVNVTVQNPDGQTVTLTNGFAYFGQPSVLPVTVSGTNVNIQFSSAAGVPYKLQYATNLTTPVNWTTMPSTNGTGGVIQLQAPIDPAQGQKFFRVSAGAP